MMSTTPSMPSTRGNRPPFQNGFFGQRTLCLSMLVTVVWSARAEQFSFLDRRPGNTQKLATDGTFDFMGGNDDDLRDEMVINLSKLANKSGKLANKSGKPGGKSIQERIWGSSTWPLPGKERRPLTGPDGSKIDAPSQVYLGLFALISMAICLCGLIWYALGLSSALSGRSEASTFRMQMSALSCAMVWRNLHKQALCSHIVQILLPTVFLFAIYKVRSTVARAFQENVDEMGEVFKGYKDTIVDGVVEMVLVLAMLYITMVSATFFVSRIAGERESGFRHLLHVSGVSRAAYMLATIGSEGILQALFGVLFVLVVSGIALKVPMVMWTSPTLLLFLVFLFVQASVMLATLVAYMCWSVRTASMIMKFVATFVCFNAPFRLAFPSIPAYGQPNYLELAMPPLVAYRCISALVTGCIRGRCIAMDDLYDTFTLGGNYAYPWTMILGAHNAPDLTPAEALISHLGLLALQLKLGWLLIVYLDTRLYPTLHSSGVHSSDSQSNDSEVLAVTNLVHWYGWLEGVMQAPTNTTLKGLSFSIGPGAMLGLLGPNGSGKTTSIRCITGEENPKEGHVKINATLTTGKCTSNVGLCPQETVLSNDLSVKENLLLFAHIRGARGADAQNFLQEILKATWLQEKCDEMPSALSGGMRRRLAVGCAMISSPAITILDEPTTGLDPMSRRGIWATINEIKSSGGCCLLTTHMLEEAEHLCTQIVVLKKGSKVAEGSVQELKEAWGSGYVLKVDCDPGNEGKAKTFISSLLPDGQCECTDDKLAQLTFKVTCNEQRLGQLIIAIAQGKQDNAIQRWGLSQASLEDTYMRIIEHSESEDGATSPGAA